MSEFTNTRENRASIRWRLLTTASALALLGATYGTDTAHAEGGDRPLVWLELDGQYSQQVNDQGIFEPPFVLASPFDAASHVGQEKAPPTTWDKGAKITFQPDGNDWVLSLGIRYGKSTRDVRLNQLTSHASHVVSGAYDAYQNFKTQSSESHAIVDFQAGKDVGLGNFGNHGSSIVSLGVRFAQFNSRNDIGIKSQPTNYNANHPYNKFYASLTAKRKFTGIGPSLSWDASASIAGNPSDGGISLDWGVNGSVLFGRQRMTAHHQTLENHWNYFEITQTPYHNSVPLARSKNVMVPNLGGFAGVSWRYADAKISLGYRADMFFGAVDGGIDAARKENVGFYGPFAGISIGIGG